MSVTAPHVVVINGPSSSGKSALAAELQRRLDDVWVRMSIDAFLLSLPLETHQIAIATQFGTLLSAFHASVAATARAGVRVLVDHVLALPAFADDLRTSIEGIPTTWVGLHCPIEELERRETARSDREPGLARSQATVVHENAEYDVFADTSQHGPAAIAAQVESILNPDHPAS